MIGFLLGYCTGVLSLFLVSGGVQAYRAARVQAHPVAPPSAEELALLRKGLANQERMYRVCLEGGDLVTAHLFKEDAVALRARLARWEQAAPG